MRQHQKSGNGWEPTFPKPGSRLPFLQPPAMRDTVTVTRKIKTKISKAPARPQTKNSDKTRPSRFERAADIEQYVEAWKLLLKRKKAYAYWHESQLRAKEVHLAHTRETLQAITDKKMRDLETKWHIGRLQYVHEARIEEDRQRLKSHWEASGTPHGSSGASMTNASTGQHMLYRNLPGFSDFTLVEVTFQQPQNARFEAKMITIKATIATLEAVAVAVEAFTQLEGAAMPHAHMQAGMHVRKQHAVVQTSVIEPGALSLEDKVTLKDRQDKLKQKLLCVEYAKKLVSSIRRAALGGSYFNVNKRKSKFLAGRRRKTKTMAKGGANSTPAIDCLDAGDCGDCMAETRQIRWHIPCSIGPPISCRRHWVPFQEPLTQRTPLGGERNMNIGLGGPGLPGNIRRGDG